MVRWHVLRRTLGISWIITFLVAVIVYALTKYNDAMRHEIIRLNFERRLFQLQDDLNRMRSVLKERDRECYMLNNSPPLAAVNQSQGEILSFPSFIDFLPHLYTVSSSRLHPARTYPNDYRKLSKTDYVIGIPTVARHNHSYLIPTLQSLIGGISSEEAKMVSIVVLISDDEGPNSSYVMEQYASVQSEFSSELNSGLLIVIVPPREWYPPDLHSLSPTFNDPPERMYWRTKQNLDYIYLMLYCQRRGEYYLQLEDDVFAKAGYISSIKKFVSEKATDNWLMLEFSSLGFIGKLFRTSDLTLLTQFIALFHRQKPVDWLLDLLFVNRYCHPEKSTKQCTEVTKRHRIRHRPSLFQHIGVHSSLAGKVQKLRERDFGKAQLYIPHRDNPPANITTTLKTYMLFVLEGGRFEHKRLLVSSVDVLILDIVNAYSGNNYYWALAPVAEDYILFEFHSAVTLIGIVIRTGNLEHQYDTLNGSAEVLLKKTDEKDFTSVARFNERGTVRVDFSEGIKVDSMKIEIHEASSNWLIINEIHIIVE